MTALPDGTLQLLQQLDEQPQLVRVKKHVRLFDQLLTKFAALFRSQMS